MAEGDVIASEVFCNFDMRATQHHVTIAVGDVHKDFERAALVARASYDAGLAAMQAKRTFGEVAVAMVEPVRAAGGWMRGPQIHSLNPFGALCGVPPDSDLSGLDGAERYPHQRGYPTQLGEMVLEPGMTFAFEPSCAFGRHAVTIGGTVIVGDDDPIELNPYTAVPVASACTDHRPGRRPKTLQHHVEPFAGSDGETLRQLRPRIKAHAVSRSCTTAFSTTDALSRRENTNARSWQRALNSFRCERSVRC